MHGSPIVARHEAGHAIVARTYGLRVDAVTISESGGHTVVSAPDIMSFEDEVSRRLADGRSISEILEEIPLLNILVDVYLGGMAAVDMVEPISWWRRAWLTVYGLLHPNPLLAVPVPFLGHIGDAPPTRFDRAEDDIDKIMQVFGLSYRSYVSDTDSRFTRSQDPYDIIFRELKRRSSIIGALLSNRWPQVHRLENMLNSCGEISGDELDRILAWQPLSRRLVPISRIVCLVLMVLSLYAMADISLGIMTGKAQIPLWKGLLGLSYFGACFWGLGAWLGLLPDPFNRRRVSLVEKVWTTMRGWSRS